MKTLLFAGILSFVLNAPSFGKTFVYVSVDGESRIAIFQVDEVSGKLSALGSKQLDATPGPLTTDPARRFMFASLRSSSELTSFKIDPTSGKLRTICTIPAGDDPAYVWTDRTGRFLLTAYYVASKVTVHEIGHDGTLKQPPLQTIPTDEKAHGIMTDRKNRFAFVPHTGPNAIYQFLFDQKSGKLTKNRPWIIETGADTGPRQLAFHPTLDIVYFDYEQGSAIAAFDLDRATGRLTFRQRLSSLPDSFHEPNSNARIEMTPNGHFIYVANRGHQSLAGYAINQQNGELTPLGQTATEANPRAFGIDPMGKFLYAAGQDTGKLAAFRIEPQTGALARFDTYEIGLRPWWVLVTQTSD